MIRHFQYDHGETCPTCGTGLKKITVGYECEYCKRFVLDSELKSPTPVPEEGKCGGCGSTFYYTEKPRVDYILGRVYATCRLCGHEQLIKEVDLDK